MKAGLFGGSWEDHIAPVDDYFGDAIRNVEIWPPMDLAPTRIRR